MPRTYIRHATMAVVVALVVLAGCGSPAWLRNSAGRIAPAGQQASNGPLHTAGGKLVDASGNEVHLTGVNWFGFETESFAPHGLMVRNWKSMLDQIALSGFNTIRLPYSNQLIDSSNTPTGIDYQLNPDLVGLKGLALMDKIVNGAGQRGLKILLDQHRPDSHAQSNLWYTSSVPESRWMSDWVMLAQHYQGNSAVIGADLHNEPHGAATWGDGNAATDWRLAAERAGNAVLAANPNWLIFVEGIENYHNDYSWWGGNLEGAKQYPVRLSLPDHLVYSAHDYGPGVSWQQWFQAPNFPQNMPAMWDKHWAYLQSDGQAPVLMGEFGGRSVGGDQEGKWQRALVDFLKSRGISYTYWSWNPDSGDTGGILNWDWKTVDQAKMHILSAYQWPLLGQPTTSSTPSPSADVKHAFSW